MGQVLSIVRIHVSVELYTGIPSTLRRVRIHDTSTNIGFGNFKELSFAETKEVGFWTTSKKTLARSVPGEFVLMLEFASIVEIGLHSTRYN